MSSSETIPSPLHTLLTHPHHRPVSNHPHHFPHLHNSPLPHHSHRRHRSDHYDNHVLGQIERSLEEGWQLISETYIKFTYCCIL